jgi:hypothetical protein
MPSSAAGTLVGMTVTSGWTSSIICGGRTLWITHEPTSWQVVADLLNGGMIKRQEVLSEPSLQTAHEVAGQQQLVLRGSSSDVLQGHPVGRRVRLCQEVEVRCTLAGPPDEFTVM